MSATFWNMRRRLKAQQKNKEVVIMNLAKAQKEEKQEEKEKKQTNKSAKELPKKRGDK